MVQQAEGVVVTEIFELVIWRYGGMMTWDPRDQTNQERHVKNRGGSEGGQRRNTPIVDCI